MDALDVKQFQAGKIKYLTFSNRDGKKWSIPMRNMNAAMEIYEPSGLKGKILKKFFSILTMLGVTKKFLRGSYTSVTMNEALKNIIIDCFGNDWEFSVFWGTPCVDQKITLQIYNKQRILGYCKIGYSGRVKELFHHEKEILDTLQDKGVPHVPICLALEQISEECWVFVQSTKKTLHSTTEHVFGEKQRQFIEDLWENTKKRILFEKTDYYQSLLFLEQNLNLIDKLYRKTVKVVLEQVKESYSGMTVEWGMIHRDYTPWNTCVVGDELFVFDLEYALMYAPKGIDRWHFFVQTMCYEKKFDMKQIAMTYLALLEEEKDDFSFINYLLDIISLYLQRGTKDDLKIANERVFLLKLIANSNY